MASLADDDTMADFDEQDPGSMERLMKHMGNEMGEDVGEEMAQAIDSPDDAGPDPDRSDGY